MDLRPTRQAIIEALNVAKISFPEQAAISQLRSLYKALSQFQNESRGTEDVPMDSGRSATTNDENMVERCVALTAAAADINNTAVIPSGIGNLIDFPHSSGIVSDVTATTSNISHGVHHNVLASGADVTNTEANVFCTNSMQDNFNVARNQIDEEQQLAKQIKILQMRCEMVNLQKQLQSLEFVDSQTRNTRRINYEELVIAVQKFSGDDNQDILKWFRHFEDYTHTCGYNDHDLLLGLKWLLHGTARQYVQNVDIVNYNDLKCALIKTFKRKLTREDVYRKLRLRILKHHESCLSYVIAMQQIAAEANIDEKELIDMAEL